MNKKSILLLFIIFLLSGCTLKDEIKYGEVDVTKFNADAEPVKSFSVAEVFMTDFVYKFGLIGEVGDHDIAVCPDGSWDVPDVSRRSRGFRYADWAFSIYMEFKAHAFIVADQFGGKEGEKISVKWFVEKEIGVLPKEWEEIAAQNDLVITKACDEQLYAHAEIDAAIIDKFVKEDKALEKPKDKNLIVSIDSNGEKPVPVRRYRVVFYKENIPIGAHEFQLIDLPYSY